MALKWINTGAFVAMVAVNALANLLPIGGKTTGQISEAYPNLFTPAPITFTIWGLIYVLMAIFVVYQWGVFDGGIYSSKVREDIGIWFAISCLLNIVWIIFWHSNLIALSTICIATLLLVLVIIEGKLTGAEGNWFQRMSAKAGFSLYYGWIIAATIANICVLLTQIGWNGWGLSEGFWMIVVLLLGAFIASAIALIAEDRIAAIAVMWAYAGILIRHISIDYFGGAHPFVIITGFFSEALILLSIVIPMLQHKIIQ